MSKYAADFLDWAVQNYYCQYKDFDSPKWYKRAPTGVPIDPPVSAGELWNTFISENNLGTYRPKRGE